MPLTKELEKFGFQKVEGDTSSIFEKLKITLKYVKIKNYTVQP